MALSSYFLKKNSAFERRRLCRPILEYLEDRCLLSGGFGQVNLASDVPGLARVTDPNLVNPWGISFSPTGPFWFANNGKGDSDLLDGRGNPVPLAVGGASAANVGITPTGTVFNGGAGFAISEHGLSAPSTFLFATEDGTISGWSEVVDPTQAVLAVDNSASGAIYKGLALAADSTGHGFLYAADFSRGTIDVFDQDFRPVLLSGSFHDANLPAGYAPFNIQNIHNLLFVTYARQSEDRRDDVPGGGNGFIDVYDADGSLVLRFASQGALDSPWGIALAPADFGPYSNALLVGNNGDGHINAYDLSSGTFLGQLADDKGSAITIPDVWALTFGNGHEGGDANTLFFAAGVNNEKHGLFGAIQAPDRRGADTAGLGAYDPSAPGEPDDYPLPPRGGPAFLESNEARLFPTSDLLPLHESSLALVPTLSTLSPSGTRIDVTGPSAPMVGVTLNGIVSTAVPGSSAVTLTPADANSQLATGASNKFVALGEFLDLNAAATIPQKAEQGPGSQLQVRQVVNLLTAIPSESLAESMDDEPGIPDKTDETQNGGGWKKLTILLVMVSIPWTWACWPRQRTTARQRPGG